MFLVSSKEKRISNSTYSSSPKVPLALPASSPAPATDTGTSQLYLSLIRQRLSAIYTRFSSSLTTLLLDVLSASKRWLIITVEVALNLASSCDNSLRLYWNQQQTCSQLTAIPLSALEHRISVPQALEFRVSSANKSRNELCDHIQLNELSLNNLWTSLSECSNNDNSTAANFQEFFSKMDLFRRRAAKILAPSDSPQSSAYCEGSCRCAKSEPKSHRTISEHREEPCANGASTNMWSQANSHSSKSSSSSNNGMNTGGGSASHSNSYRVCAQLEAPMEFQRRSVTGPCMGLSSTPLNMRDLVKKQHLLLQQQQQQKQNNDHRASRGIRNEVQPHQEFKQQSYLSRASTTSFIPRDIYAARLANSNCNMDKLQYHKIGSSCVHPGFRDGHRHVNNSQSQSSMVLVSQDTLKNLMDQVAMSMKKVKDLEEKVRVIPDLQRQIDCMASSCSSVENLRQPSTRTNRYDSTGSVTSITRQNYTRNHSSNNDNRDFHSPNRHRNYNSFTYSINRSDRHTPGRDSIQSPSRVNSLGTRSIVASPSNSMQYCSRKKSISNRDSDQSPNRLSPAGVRSTRGSLSSMERTNSRIEYEELINDLISLSYSVDHPNSIQSNVDESLQTASISPEQRSASTTTPTEFKRDIIKVKTDGDAPTHKKITAEASSATSEDDENPDEDEDETNGGSLDGDGPSSLGSSYQDPSDFEEYCAYGASLDRRTKDFMSQSTKIPNDLRFALIRLNDYIKKNRPLAEIESSSGCLEVIKREWFQIASKSDSQACKTKLYVEYFESFTKQLLNKVVNLTDTAGNTAMHYAASHSKMDIIKVLLDTKVCDVNCRNKAGYTAIMLLSLAVIESAHDQEIAKQLFLSGDVNIKARKTGQTALMLAAGHGKALTCRLLLECGADPSLQDYDGSTALMCGSEIGNEDVVKILLAHRNTDPQAVDNDGLDALTIAMNNRHRNISLILYSAKNVPKMQRSAISSNVNSNRIIGNGNSNRNGSRSLNNSGGCLGASMRRSRGKIASNYIRRADSLLTRTKPAWRNNK